MLFLCSLQRKLDADPTRPTSATAGHTGLTTTLRSAMHTQAAALPKTVTFRDPLCECREFDNEEAAAAVRTAVTTTTTTMCAALPEHPGSHLPSALRTSQSPAPGKSVQSAERLCECREFDNEEATAAVGTTVTTTTTMGAARPADPGVPTHSALRSPRSTAAPKSVRFAEPLCEYRLFRSEEAAAAVGAAGIA